MKIKIILLLILCSCSTSLPVIKELNTGKFYKRDMIVTVNGETVEGVGVFKRSYSYDFEVEARGDLDLFVLNTCHRSMEKEKAWNVTKKVRRLLWTKKITDKRKVKFTYIPTVIEKGYCPIRLGGYEKELGRHSWAFIDFEDYTDTLKATLSCNGVTLKTNGVSVCQSRKGFLQEIQFATDTLVDSSKECLKEVKKKGTRFEISLPLGECVYIFMNKDGASHRLTTLGTDGIFIRDE